MIGYYVHHVGQGHVQRARLLAAALDQPVTGLSSLPRPQGWSGDWVQLPRDDTAASPYDVSADGHLHWAPLDDAGVRARAACVSSWIHAHAPEVLVVDVSVEVTVLARLHGVRVVSVLPPGRRGDPVHRLGHGLSSALVSFWPPEAKGMLPGVPMTTTRRVLALGALSRFAPRLPDPRPGGARRVSVLLGAGGTDVGDSDLVAAARQTPHWQWTVLDGTRDAEEVRRTLSESDVVVTHAGESALAEVSALRRPAVVVPQPRPFGEQVTAARALARGAWPVVVRESFPTEGWGDLLARASRLDGCAWAPWCDGRAAARFGDVIQGVRRGPAKT